MTVTAEPRADEPLTSDDRPPPARRRWATPAAVALVALVVSPIVVGCFALIGETYLPMSDWAHMTFRVSQVGTRETPLVGAYSFHQFAHPGPLPFWVGAPLFRLTGEDPRALLWTAAAVNVVSVGALAAVAWRRGRWPLLLAAMALAGVLVHGFGPELLVDLWNPYTPLLPFLLVIFLAWDAALGRRRAVVEAILPATYAAQAHLAFVPLTIALVAWGLAWHRWGGRLVAAGEAATGADEVAAAPDPAPGPAEAAGPWWRRWWAAVPRPAIVMTGVLWLAPAFDAVFDIHNPARIAWSVVHPEEYVVGLVKAPTVVGRFLRPDGPSVTGNDVAERYAVSAGGDALVLVAALALLAACLVVARRRRLPDVAALATLTLTLLVVAVQGTAQLLVPLMDYLTEWVKLVAGLLWFTVGWTAWRVAEPSLRARAARRADERPAGAGGWPVRVVGLAAVLGVVTAAALTWSDAADLDAPANAEPGEVEGILAAARERLEDGVTYRIEFAGHTHAYFPGLMYSLAQNGKDLQTSDGAGGLKWGHAHRWVEGEPYDVALVVAIQHTPSREKPFDECMADPDMERVYIDDPLSADERAWAEDVTFRRAVDPDSVTEAERRRVHALYRRGPQVGLFLGDHLCAVSGPGQHATG